MNHPGGCEPTCNKKKEEEQEEDQPQTHKQQGPQIVAAASPQESTESNHSLLPQPVASSSDQGHNEAMVAVAADLAVASAAERRMRKPGEVAAALAGGGSGSGSLPPRRYWWGDCLPHVVLLREALLSSAPDIAVLGPLHGCFAFYMTHLHNDVLSSTYAKTLTFGANVTRLESGFMWVGGWRPTSALVLVYSLMGIDIENALQAVRAGRDIGENSTASLLSTRQLAVLHSLQKHTQHAEMKISKKITVLQMLIGDQDMLEAVLLDAASPIANDSSRFHQVAEKKKSRFRRLLIQAEELRLHTLKDLLSLLTPIQAARCGVAVFELCSSMRTMGSTVPPVLPARSVLVLPVVTLPLPASSGLVEKPLVASSGEAVNPDPSTSVSFLSSSDDALPELISPLEPLVADLSTSHSNMINSRTVPVNQSCQPWPSVSSSDSPLRQSLQTVVSNLSTSDNSIPDTSNVSISQSYVTHLPHISVSNNQQTSDVEVSQSDETAAVLLPIISPCTYNTSSLLLAPESSRPLIKEKKCKSWPTILPLAQSNLDDSVDGLVPTADEDSGVGKGLREGIISNRLLLLSPASSDVIIQNCSLDSPRLTDFELHAQLPLTNDDRGKSNQVRPASSTMADMRQLRHNRPGQMSVPCECAPQVSQAKEATEVKLSVSE